MPDAAGESTLPTTARGHGKLILCGEHAVVYGHPAIGLAVDRGTEVHLTACDGPTRLSGGEVPDARLAAAIGLVLPSSGVSIEIRSDLPMGCGMGSSAALAVAMVRAEAARRGEAIDHDTVWERAFDVERVFHGNPSGLDHALATRGGVLRFVRGTPPSVQRLPRPGWHIVVYDTGRAGDTAALVAGVALRRPGIDPLLDRIGSLVDEAAGVLQDLDALGALLDENHLLLRGIGVSTPELDELVTLARRAGAAGAKLSGAGGGGVVLAITDDPAPLLDAGRRHGVRAFACQVAEDT